MARPRPHQELQFIVLEPTYTMMPVPFKDPNAPLWHSPQRRKTSTNPRSHVPLSFSHRSGRAAFCVLRAPLLSRFPQRALQAATPLGKSHECASLGPKRTSEHLLRRRGGRRPSQMHTSSLPNEGFGKPLLKAAESTHALTHRPSTGSAYSLIPLCWRKPSSETYRRDSL